MMVFGNRFNAQHEVRHMRRRIGIVPGVLVVLALLHAALAAAQEAEGPRMTGTVHLRGGETLQGIILAAEFGVADRDGIGEIFTDGGAIRLSVQGKDQDIPASEIAEIVADWQDAGDETKSDWVIASITITKKTGEKVTGKPTWFMHASYAKIEVEGELVRVSAFPLGRNFDPDKLVVRVVLGEAAAAPAPAPAPGTPGPTEPVVAPGTPTPVPGTPTTGTRTVDPGVVTPPPAPTPRPGEKPASVALTIQCPKCGEFITVDLAGYAR